jgi:hypothetical protein
MMLVGLMATHTPIATDALIMSLLRSEDYDRVRSERLMLRSARFWRENAPDAVCKAVAAGYWGNALPRPVIHEESVTIELHNEQ